MKNSFKFNLWYISEDTEAGTGSLIKFDASYLFHSIAVYGFYRLCIAVDFWNPKRIWKAKWHDVPVLCIRALDCSKQLVISEHPLSSWKVLLNFQRIGPCSNFCPCLIPSESSLSLHETLQEFGNKCQICSLSLTVLPSNETFVSFWPTKEHSRLLGVWAWGWTDVLFKDGILTELIQLCWTLNCFKCWWLNPYTNEVWATFLFSSSRISVALLSHNLLYLTNIL